MGLLCRGAYKLEQRRRYGRTAAGMSNPSGPDQGNEPAVESADEPTTDDASAPEETQTVGQRTDRSGPASVDEAPAGVEEHPTEVMTVESTGTAERIAAGRIVRRAAVHRTLRDGLVDEEDRNASRAGHRGAVGRTHRTVVAAAATEPIQPAPTGHPGPRGCAQATGTATQLGLGGGADPGDRRARRRRDTGHGAVDPRLRTEGVAGGHGPLDDPELRCRGAEGRPGHPAQHHLRRHPRQLRQLRRPRVGRHPLPGWPRPSSTRWWPASTRSWSTATTPRPT